MKKRIVFLVSLIPLVLFSAVLMGADQATQQNKVPVAQQLRKLDRQFQNDIKKFRQQQPQEKKHKGPLTKSEMLRKSHLKEQILLRTLEHERKRRVFLEQLPN